MRMPGINRPSFMRGAAVKREIILCVLWLLLALCLSVESYRLGLSAANRPGPGFFPFVAATAIGLIAAFRLIHSIRKTPSDDHWEPGTAQEARLVLCVVAGMLAYAFLLESLGFLFGTFLLVAFYLRVIAARRWLVAISFAGTVALAAHFFFDLLLKAELPRGLLGWLV
jgi:putative tricarboxylic transport membrane protein